MTLLGLGPVKLERDQIPLPTSAPERLHCGNPRCITGGEAGVDPIFVSGKDGKMRCFYCGRPVRG